MRLSLKYRFIITFAGLIVLSSVVLCLLIGLQASRMAQEQIGSNLADTAFQMADKLDRIMWVRSREILLLASLDTFREPAQRRQSAHVIEQFQSSIPFYSWIGLLDPKGNVLEATGNILKGQNIAQRPVFNQATEGLFVGDVHDAVLLSKLLPNPTGEQMQFVDVSAPLKDSSGRFTGVLASHLSWGWARDVEASILSAFKESREVDLLIVAADGTVLLGDKSLLGKKLALAIMRQVRDRTSIWAVETWPDGDAYLTGASFGRGFRDYKGLGWTVVARQPLNRAYKAVYALVRDMFLVGLGLSVLFALAGWFVATKVIQPLQAIAHAADQIRMGADVRIPESRNIPEIQALSMSLSSLIRSLTKSETARDRMERLATRDPLTGLFNRLGLTEFLTTALPRLKREQGGLELLCMDLDGFKKVNDTLGHQMGDQLLKEVSTRLTGCLRGGDMLIRQGGDEFMVLLESKGDASHEVTQLARRILDAIHEPFKLPGREVQVGVSIGSASWPRHGAAFEEVAANADSALYEAKSKGKNRLVTWKESTTASANSTTQS